VIYERNLEEDATMSEAGTHRSTFGPAVFYRDPRAALEWLEKAFGFETTLLITDEAGNVAHSEMNFGDGYIMVGGEWSGRIAWEDPAMRNIKAPGSVGGANTQNVHVQLTEDIDAHCERARAAGARIEQEPETQFYGDRTYRAVDLEGHMWTFGQTVKVMSQDEWAAASGLKVTSSL
jgi:uncharacterized glyoxalase superfamily protein PhnB